MSIPEGVAVTADLCIGIPYIPLSPERHHCGGALHVAAGGDADIGGVRGDDVLRAPGRELGGLGEGLRLPGKRRTASYAQCPCDITTIKAFADNGFIFMNGL